MQLTNRKLILTLAAKFIVALAVLITVPTIVASAASAEVVEMCTTLDLETFTGIN